MIKKLLSQRGETLTEVLVAIVVVALTAAMLATLITTSARISIRADQAAKDIYDELNRAEGVADTVTLESSTVKINDQEFEVVYYGTGGGLLSYRGVEP